MNINDMYEKFKLEFNNVSNFKKTTFYKKILLGSGYRFK